MRRLALFAGLAVTAVPATAQTKADDLPECSAILPATKVASGRRALVPEDLARLRDMGPGEPQYYAEPFFTVSPDGGRAAFQLPGRN